MQDPISLMKDISQLVKKYNDLDLMKQIVELQTAVFEQQQENLKLSKELANAIEQLEMRSKLKLQPFGNSHYYMMDDESVAYCPVCYGTKKQLIPLPIQPSRLRNGIINYGRHCASCKSDFDERVHNTSA